MTIHPRCLLLLLTLVALPTLAQETGGLQQRMSSTEFAAAGLNKLTPQELQNLDGWLNSHRKVTTKLVDTSGKPVFYAGKDKPGKIHAHVAGHFGGWSGSSQFTLDNGQVWKQRGSETPSCMTSDNPSVVVKPSLMGNWLMYVDGCNDSVHVERIR